MAPSGGILAPIAMRILRHAVTKTSNLIKSRFSEASRPLNNNLQPVLVRTTPRQPIHPVAALRQSKGRWYTTHSAINAAVRRFTSTGASHTSKYSRAAFPKSATSSAVSRLTIRAPFASTLRPNLTGGAIPRTAGGYTISGGRAGGARHFSHTPAAPAQVVNNVSAAIRAFWLSGQKAQFDGTTPAGEKRYRSVSNLQRETSRHMRSVPRSTPGSYIDFHVNPTITALSPLGVTFNSIMEQPTPNLNTEGFLDVLSVDFSRALKDLAAILNDLKRLSSLGDLNISLEQKSVLRVRFPGCDAGTVERLCDEVGVQRGVVFEDPDFHAGIGADVALLFPFAPSSGQAMSSPAGSLRSQRFQDYDALDDAHGSPWLEGYESMEDESDSGSIYFTKPSPELQDSSQYEGLEGIYRFLEECDNARRL